MPPDTSTANTSAPSTGASTGTASTPSTTKSTGNVMTASSFRTSTRQRTAEAPELDPQPSTSTSDDSVDLSSSDDTADSDVNVDATEPELEATDDGEPVEEDLSWLQELKDYKQLHGLDLKEIVQALANGQLPDALHDIIKIKLKNGDQEWESPLSKARREAMLHHDYTQKLQALSAEREEYNTDKNEFIEMLQGWKGNPDALLSGLERLEFPVLEAAKLLAKRHQELAAMTPREREFYEKNQALERQIAKDKFEQRRLEQSKGAEKSKIDGEKMADFVSTTASDLFAKAKLPRDEKTWNLFLNKFKVISSSYPPGTQWTEEMVSDAVEATAHVHREAYGHRAQAQAAANKQPAKQPLVQPEFTSPAREQVAKLKGQPTQAPKRPGQKGGKMTGSEFRKQFLGR